MVTEKLAWVSSNDVLTRKAVEGLIDYCRMQNIHLEWEEVLNFVHGKPITLEDVAQYTVDALNEDAPKGWWYTLTADANLLLQIDEEVAVDA